jgi:hypothetical protein
VSVLLTHLLDLVSAIHGHRVRFTAFSDEARTLLTAHSQLLGQIGFSGGVSRGVLWVFSHPFILSAAGDPKTGTIGGTAHFQRSGSAT